MTDTTSAPTGRLARGRFTSGPPPAMATASSTTSRSAPTCGSFDITEGEIDTGDGITELGLICEACGTAWPVACVVDWDTPRSGVVAMPRRNHNAGRPPSTATSSPPASTTSAAILTVADGKYPLRRMPQARPLERPTTAPCARAASILSARPAPSSRR